MKKSNFNAFETIAANMSEHETSSGDEFLLVYHWK